MQGVDVTKLFRKTIFQDEAGVIITELFPIVVTNEGRIVDDPIRQPAYEGLCFYNNQPMPFKISGPKNLREACEQYLAGVDALKEKIEADQRKQRILSANEGNIRAPR